MINKLFSIVAFILSKSRFSGKMIFLENFHQKHSEFLIVVFSLKISGFSLFQEIVSTELEKDKSISSKYIPAIGASIIISKSHSNISTTICQISSFHSAFINLLSSSQIQKNLAIE
jgi:hypothetical protein